MERCGHSQAGSFTSATTPYRGASADSSSRSGCVRSGSPCLAVAGEAADLAVAQPVVDEGEELTSRGDPGDVLPPAFRDAVVVLLDLLRAPHMRDGLDRCPPDEDRALLGDPAPADLQVRLPMLGGHPSPRAQLTGPGEAGDVTDLGHEDGGQGVADTVELLDGPVAMVVAQPAVDLPLEEVDLLVEDGDEIPQRLHPVQVPAIQRSVVEELLPFRAPQIGHRWEQSL